MTSDNWLKTHYARLGKAQPLNLLMMPQANGDAVNFGYAAEIADEGPRPQPIAEIAPHLLAAEPKDTALWPALFEVFPNWRWGMQPTGDCTRWMQQHLLDVLAAVLALNGRIASPEAQVAGEATYGFAKCELERSYRYHGAGSTGWNVAEATVKFGCLYRRKYEADGKSIDLSRETELSVAWGDQGKGVPDWLEPFAAEHQAVDRLNPKTAAEAGKLIQAGYPVQHCGFASWARKRDDRGIGYKFSSGWHAMTLTGVLWGSDGNPLAFWNANTGHGNHCTGPTGPIPVPSVYAECGGWLPARLVARVLAAGDCHAHTMIEGWPVNDLPDWGGRAYL